MLSAFLAILLLLSIVIYLKKQKAQERRAATQRDLPREQLLPRHYKSFVEVENKLWGAAEESERSTKWNTGEIKLRTAEAQLVREYVKGLGQDFAQGNRIFSVVIARSTNAKILKELETHRMKIEFPYYALCALVRLRLWTDRVSLRELRRLTEVVATMAYEVRSMVNTLEQAGHDEFVEALLRKY
jgi:hypothetical protein